MALINCFETHYIATGYRDAHIFNLSNINPLDPASRHDPLQIRISHNLTTGKHTAATPAPSGHDHAAARTKLINRVGVCLKQLLWREYGGDKNIVDRKDIGAIMATRNPLLADTPPLDALQQIKTQLEAYSKSRDPFDRPISSGQSVRQWWERVQKDEEAHVIGVRAAGSSSIL